MEVMDNTAKFLCEKIGGAKLAYVQSDEISILMTDFDKIDTQAWFDGNVQKIVSISAAMATAEFNRLMYLARPEFLEKGKMAHFDSRVWSISDVFEVENVFIWRQQDTRRNSVSMAAQSMFSHKELHGKNTKIMREMMLASGTDWESYPAGFRNGRCVVRNTFVEPIGVCRKFDCQTEGCAYSPCYKNEPVTRSRWEIEAAPVFVENREYLRSIIPLMPNFLTDENMDA
jgi:tRNA(His) 5'-end guanylyltransferase